MSENNFFPAETNSRQHILVVDDDPHIRRLNIEVLAGQGYAATAAANGAAAWDELQLNHYDLLITENEMPMLSGLGLIRRLQDAQRDLPVIMLTGTLPHEQLARHPELQIEAVLLKPCAFDEFLNAVKNVLHARDAGQTAIVMPRPERLPNAARLRVE
ncbi:MAG TPA: response regulator [Verrucomicrobiae bacterium]|nr:response regulator [Verrucomicrobiae bacterium]